MSPSPSSCNKRPGQSPPPASVSPCTCTAPFYLTLFSRSRAYKWNRRNTAAAAATSFLSNHLPLASSPPSSSLTNSARSHRFFEAATWPLLPVYQSLFVVICHRLRFLIATAASCRPRHRRLLLPTPQTRPRRTRATAPSCASLSASSKSQSFVFLALPSPVDAMATDRNFAPRADLSVSPILPLFGSPYPPNCSSQHPISNTGITSTPPMPSSPSAPRTTPSTACSRFCGFGSQKI